ncbi:MAG: hypothetical protein EOP22_11915 [Hyphomicrobiales bacterium]|nr:MAG: hypothetical protein EOP22_11915 [Hyphomicrobiales bacterium]
MRYSSVFRLLLMAAGLAGLSFAATPAQADRPTVREQIQHYLECLDWMFNDPARHAIECAPGHEYFIPEDKLGDGKARCPDYIPSAYLQVGRYDHCPPPCDDRVGYVGVTYDNCYEPCTEKSAFLRTNGYDGCNEPCYPQQGSLTIGPTPQLRMLMPVAYDPECPVIAPLAPNELQLFEI